MKHQRWVTILCTFTLLTLVWVVTSAQARSARETEDLPSTSLDDFVIYGEPRVMDGLRRSPFTKRDPVVERFFRQLPGITESVYQENLTAMEAYLKRAQEGHYQKLQGLARLAGLEAPTQGLLDGYEERLDTLETLLKWMKKEKPVQLTQLDIWDASDLRYRLARVPITNIRQNPDTGDLESRLLFDWKLIYQPRDRAHDVVLRFRMGIHQQNQTGFYDPNGFTHWYNIRTRDFNAIQYSYPVIITPELRKDTDKEMPRYLSAYRNTVDSFYHIIREFFFSDLADLHSLYILTRGRLFADEWRQFQATPLQRGLAAYLAFKSLEGQIGRQKAQQILENDWTTWHIRKIGKGYDPLVWEGEVRPYETYGAYKNDPNLRNIYWSTQFVFYLVEVYGESFVKDFCRGMRQKQGPGGSKEGEAELFQSITGDNIEVVTDSFKAAHSS